MEERLAQRLPSGKESSAAAEMRAKLVPQKYMVNAVHAAFIKAHTRAHTPCGCCARRPQRRGLPSLDGRGEVVSVVHGEFPQQWHILC